MKASVLEASILKDSESSHNTLFLWRSFILVFLSIVLITSTVQAKDITLSLNQSDYYFKVGNEAILNLNANNSYDETINGLLSYTITQSLNQGGFQYSSSNTKSTSFSLGAGESNTPISFGSSDTPLVFSVGLKFSFTKDDPKEVTLGDIRIHFVDDNKQSNNQAQQNQQKPVSSSSKKASQQSNNQNDPFAQQNQKMQQLMNQMMGNPNQQQQQQSPEQRLQNNQMSQDSSALKQQMNKQMQEQQQIRNEFQKQLAQNKEFQKNHKDLLDQGYNLTDAEINPSSNNTGDFKLNYKKSSGEKASLSGRMKNGEMQSMHKDTPQNREQMLKNLESDKKFQKYQKELQNQGFSLNSTQFLQNQNNTQIKMSYSNQKNESAIIQADVINDSIKNVELKKENTTRHNYFWFFLLLIVLSGIVYLVYRKFSRKPTPEKSIPKKVVQKPIDYRSESLKMLVKAKKQFADKKYKDAYGLAAQALRFFLSYENNLNKEVTNDEIIGFIKNDYTNYKEVKQCFDLCSLVEFAKYDANKKDFDKIITYAHHVISGKK